MGEIASEYGSDFNSITDKMSEQLSLMFNFPVSFFLVPYTLADPFNNLNNPVFEILLTVTREEMKKTLPNLAKEQAHQVYLQIKQTFDTFKKEVIERINQDINSRKTAVDELVAQKQSTEIDQLCTFNNEIYMEDSKITDLKEKLTANQILHQQLADYLIDLADCLYFLHLEEEAKDLQILSKNLIEKDHKILLLGGFAHGKSTILNTLIGQNILHTSYYLQFPFTIRYGQKQRVIINFKNRKPSQTVNLTIFQKLYYLYHEELDENKMLFLEEIEYVIIETPSPLLATGIKFIKYPSFTCREDIDFLISCINQAHTILFVLLATRPCTKEERVYLERYIKDQDLNVFFLVNRWDIIASQLEDEDELEEAERKVRQVFRSNLEPYCVVEGKNLYEQRVFETSALQAFKAQRKGEPLTGTGIDEFLYSLLKFILKQNKSEILTIKSFVRNIQQKLHQTVIEKILRETKEKLINTKEEICFLEEETIKIINLIDDLFDTYLSPC